MMNPNAPCFIPHAYDRLRESVTPKARPLPDALPELQAPNEAPALRKSPQAMLQSRIPRRNPDALKAQQCLLQSLLPAEPSRSDSDYATPLLRAPSGLSLVPSPGLQSTISIVLPTPCPAVVHATPPPSLVHSDVNAQATASSWLAPLPSVQTHTPTIELLATLARVEHRLTQTRLIAGRPEGEAHLRRGAPLWDVRLLELSHWWKAHADLLRIATAVYEDPSDDVRHEFERCVDSVDIFRLRLTWQLTLSMPGEGGEKARSQNVESA